MGHMDVTKQLKGGDGDGIPVHSKLALLPNNLIGTKRGLNICIFHQTLRAPQSNAKRCACGLDCNVVVDIRENELTMAKDAFNVDTCGY